MADDFLITNDDVPAGPHDGPIRIGASVGNRVRLVTSGRVAIVEMVSFSGTWYNLRAEDTGETFGRWFQECEFEVIK